MFRILVLTALTMVAACTSSEDEKNLDETRPVFTRLPIDISNASDGGNGIFGDLDCSHVGDDPILRFCILVFGKNRLGSEKPNVDHTFRTVEGASVYAGFSGKVVRVEANPNGETDYAVFINPNTNMDSDSIHQYLVEYDHVIDVQVSAGDVVEAGTVIGKSPFDKQNNYGRFELQISRYSVDGQNAKQESVECPYKFFTSEVQAKIDQALALGHNVNFPENSSDRMCYEESLPASAAQ